MFDKILVPLDGSPLSERALAPALTMAQQPGAELIFARVPTADASHGPPTGRQLEAALREIAQYFAALCAAQSPAIQIRTLVPEGDVASAIVDTAAAEHADLIIMSTHGYSGVTRWLLGSVTEKVLRTAPCPVLAIRTPVLAIRTPVLAGSTPVQAGSTPVQAGSTPVQAGSTPHPIQQVAITLDGSELSERAIEPGLEIARRLNGTVTFLRVVPRVVIDRSLDEVERGLSRRAQQDLIDEAAAYLAARSARHAQSGREITTEVRVGPAADNIYDFVEAYGTDLIVMATHGRTGLQRWVYGSVTQKVLHSVNTSLLVFRPVSSKRWSMRSSE